MLSKSLRPLLIHHIPTIPRAIDWEEVSSNNLQALLKDGLSKTIKYNFYKIYHLIFEQYFWPMKTVPSTNAPRELKSITM